MTGRRTANPPNRRTGTTAPSRHTLAAGPPGSARRATGSSRPSAAPRHPSSTSLLGASHEASSMMSGTAYLTQDDRVDDGKDPKWMKKMMTRLVRYLRRSPAFAAISAEQLKLPQKKLVLQIFALLYSHPTFAAGPHEISGDADASVIAAFKILQYPFQITKSHMSGAGQRAGWSRLIAAFDWMLDLIDLDEEEEEELHLEDSERQDHYAKIYSAWLLDDDVTVDNLAVDFKERLEEKQQLVEAELGSREEELAGAELQLQTVTDVVERPAILANNIRHVKDRIDEKEAAQVQSSEHLSALTEARTALTNEVVQRRDQLAALQHEKLQLETRFREQRLNESEYEEISNLVAKRQQQVEEDQATLKAAKMGEAEQTSRVKTLQREVAAERLTLHQKLDKLRAAHVELGLSFEDTVGLQQQHCRLLDLLRGLTDQTDLFHQTAEHLERSVDQLRRDAENRTISLSDITAQVEQQVCIKQRVAAAATKERARDAAQTREWENMLAQLEEETTEIRVALRRDRESYEIIINLQEATLGRMKKGALEYAEASMARLLKTREICRKLGEE